MNWNYKTWSPRNRFIFYVIFIILSTMVVCHKLGAEETVGEHVQEAVYDVLSAAGMSIAAFEATALGNPATGMILCSLATREVFQAFYEARAAWNIYFDSSYSNEMDISPAESQIDHGRD